jgi:hypothetical protein
VRVTDKTATIYRNLSKGAYGHLKRQQTRQNIRRFGVNSFSNHTSKVARYSAQKKSSVNVDHAVDQYEKQLKEEAHGSVDRGEHAPATELTNARSVCKLAKPPGSKTVRDFRRSSFGWGPTALTALDRNLLHGSGLSFLAILQRLDARADSSTSTAVPNLFEVGDIVVVRGDDEYELLRVSKPQPVSRTSPRSLVYGHRLLESDDLDVYNAVEEIESKVQYACLVQVAGKCMVLSRESYEVSLTAGAMSITLSDDLVDSIQAALRAPEKQVPDVQSSSEDEAVDGLAQAQREREQRNAILFARGDMPRSQRIL